MITHFRKYNVWYLYAIVVCLLFFVRIYNIPTHLTFLSDQGRDATILKRLVTFEKFVFVGPTTSIGNVFTGPFYYYLVAPFMLLWRLYPTGPAYGIALMNSVGIIIASVVLGHLFDRRVGIYFLIIAGFAATQVTQSRFSWNPNPVPLFTFFTLYAGYALLSVSRQSPWCMRRVAILAVCTGLLFGISLQLHYVTIIVILPLLLEYLYIHVSFRNRLKTFVWAAIAATVTFIPPILFEVKNHFIILQTLLRARTAGEVVAKNFFYHERLADTTHAFIAHAFGFKVNNSAAVIFILLLILSTMWYTYKKYPHALFVRLCTLTILLWLPLFARLETGRHMHYYNVQYLPMYALFAIWLGYGVARIRNAHFFVVLFLCIFVYLQAQSYRYIFMQKPTTQLGDAKLVAQYIISQIRYPHAFQLVGLPFYEVEGHYRYFLEYFGMRPMPADTLGDPKQLFVICHDVAHCVIPGNPQWQIADYQNRHPDWRTTDSQKVADVTIYTIQ